MVNIKFHCFSVELSSYKIFLMQLIFSVNLQDITKEYSLSSAPVVTIAFLFIKKKMA